MSHRTQRPSLAGTLLPADAEPCIWMSAGLVAYRLCDRDFDCERCPLDAALRAIPQSAAATDGDPAGPARWRFPSDRRYHPAHTWARDRRGETVRCGIDAFAAALLRDARHVILPTPGGRLRAGRTACWLAEGLEVVPLRSPVSGTVLRTNPALGEQPGLVSSSPYDHGWLFEARLGVRRGETPLLEAGVARERADRLIRELRRRACGLLPRAEAVGRTLPDGGEPVADLRRALGAGRYYRLVARYLT